MMFDLTRKALEEFDNQHDFERMCADMLNALGNEDVVLVAPRGGPDEGKDITFSFGRGEKGLAWVTLRKDIERKFEEDSSRRTAGEFDKYVLFSTAYIGSNLKKQFAEYCLSELQGEFVPQDIEAIASLLDTSLKEIRRKYLHIVTEGTEKQRRRAILGMLRQKYMLSHDGLSPGLIAGLEPLPKEWVERELKAMGEAWTPDEHE